MRASCSDYENHPPLIPAKAGIQLKGAEEEGWAEFENNQATQSSMNWFSAFAGMSG
jgi:hypothetical protein